MEEDEDFAGSSNKKRCPQMKEHEINILLNLVVEYPAVLNNRHDHESTTLKNRDWKMIVDGFNSDPNINHERTENQIKKAFSNLIQRSRQFFNSREISWSDYPEDCTEKRAMQIFTAGMDCSDDPDAAKQACRVYLKNCEDSNQSRRRMRDALRQKPKVNYREIDGLDDLEEDEDEDNSDEEFDRLKQFIRWQKSKKRKLAQEKMANSMAIPIINGSQEPPSISRLEKIIIKHRTIEHKHKLRVLVLQEKYWKHKILSEFGADDGHNQTSSSGHNEMNGHHEETTVMAVESHTDDDPVRNGIL